MTKTKNILLFGMTGSGKSTLANVLLNKNGNFEEVFESDDSAINTTREVQTAEWEEEGTKYRIIDTVGIGDTRLNHQQAAAKLTEACQVANQGEGLTQILFTVNGRFSDIVETYKVLKLIDKDIAKYTTIVRTYFVNFENEEKCQQANNFLTDETRCRPEIIQVFKEIAQIVYVDNPPINQEWDEEDEEWQLKIKKSNEFRQKKRQASRKILINHLKTCQNTLSLTNLDSLSQRVEDCLDNQVKKRKQEQEEIKNSWNSGSFFTDDIDKLKKQFAEEEAKLAQAQKEREERQKLEEQKRDKTNPEIIELVSLQEKTIDFFRNLEKMCENGFQPLLSVEDYNELTISITENKWLSKENKIIIQNLMFSQGGQSIIQAADNPDSPDNEQLKELKLPEEYYNLIKGYFTEAQAEVKKQKSNHEKIEPVNNPNGNLGTIFLSCGIGTLIILGGIWLIRKII